MIIQIHMYIFIRHTSSIYVPSLQIFTVSIHLCNLLKDCNQLVIVWQSGRLGLHGCIQPDGCRIDTTIYHNQYICCVSDFSLLNFSTPVKLWVTPTFLCLLKNDLEVINIKKNKIEFLIDILMDHPINTVSGGKRAWLRSFK